MTDIKTSFRRFIMTALSVALLTAQLPMGVLAQGELQAAGDGVPSEITTWEELQTAIAAGGEIILTQDIVAEEDDPYLSIPKDKTVTIDLNGHKIDRNLSGKSPSADGYVIKVESGSSKTKHTKLTVKDSSDAKTGLITGGNNSGSGGGVYVNYYAEFTLDGGTISGNSSGGSGGGVYVNSEAEFTLKNGRICGNTAGNGGGVYVTGGGSFVMEDGEITGNSASSGDGGGVKIHNGSFTLEDGVISGNQAKTNGGGVSILSSGTFTMNGGTITGNTSANNGGGVYNCKTFTMNGGTITGNTSANNGGGVYIYNNDVGVTTPA